MEFATTNTVRDKTFLLIIPKMTSNELHRIQSYSILMRVSYKFLGNLQFVFYITNLSMYELDSLNSKNSSDTEKKIFVYLLYIVLNIQRNSCRQRTLFSKTEIYMGKNKRC